MIRDFLFFALGAFSMMVMMGITAVQLFEYWEEKHEIEQK